MINIKRHIGALDTGTRCYVIYNYLPDPDGDYCLIVEPDSLPEQYATAVRDVVNGAGQKHKNLYDAMDKEFMPSGTHMLSALHQGRYLRKVATNTVTMLLSSEYTLKLNLLNIELKKEEAAAAQQSEVKVSDSTVAEMLLSEGQKLIALGEEKIYKAYELRPELRTPPIKIEAAAEDPNKAVFIFDKTMSQTKIVEQLKKFIKDQR